MNIEKRIAEFNDFQRTAYYSQINSHSYVVAIRQSTRAGEWESPTVDVQYLSGLSIDDLESLRAVLLDAQSIAERWAKTERGQPLD